MIVVVVVAVAVRLAATIAIEIVVSEIIAAECFTTLAWGKVQVSMRSVGVCGSDLGFWLKARLAERTLNGPRMMGHEPSAVVSKLGPGVTHLKVGDRVVIEPKMVCGLCYYCKRGLYNFCDMPLNKGCIARFTCVPAAMTFRLPDNMSFDEGALVQPMALAYYACERSGMRAGLDVLVTGSGCLGMTVILAAKAFGAHKICSTDVLQKRLDFAGKIGADATVLVKPDEDPESAAKRIIEAMGREPDITIECSGSPSATSTGIFATRPRGVVLQVGFSLDSISIPLVVATCKELDIKGNHSSVNRRGGPREVRVPNEGGGAG
ncbi:sorbitol dehydrogenase-like [Elysia marginata]|uniref:Sorbitol dehydrogenase n=1 Tax=Elysia marginata TaxID=1093978 RepID=A0AAV4IW18_9GAST|nr:sorbitol dehydrogenase-like [Elysia marginata]